MVGTMSAYNTKRLQIIASLILILLFSLALFSLSCEPGDRLVVKNQSNQDVNIYVITVHEEDSSGNEISGQVRNYGIVPAKTTKELASITFVNKEWIYRIEAKYLTGDTVFSHEYNWYDLEKIDWKIVIPP
jgi:hypothetical protein